MKTIDLKPGTTYRGQKDITRRILRIVARDKIYASVVYEEDGVDHVLKLQSFADWAVRETKP